jgi:hypothetical protein
MYRPSVYFRLLAVIPFALRRFPNYFLDLFLGFWYDKMDLLD